MPDELAYPRLRAYLYSLPWAILPEKLAAIEEVLCLRAAGVRFDADEIQARIGAAAPVRAVSVSPGGVAVIPVYGTISMRANLFTQASGGTSTQQLSDAVRLALADPDIKAIVFDVDSPGGTVDGVPELADELNSYRGQKPMAAVANTLMASAAYWLMSQVAEIVASPSAQVGSIGVLAMHQDASRAYDAEGVTTNLISAGKYKTEGNPYEPLSDDARAAMQSQVDDFYGMFVNAVARGRGVSADQVRNGMGEGRVVTARRAVSLGLADRVATLPDTIARLSSGQGRARVKAEPEIPTMTAAAGPRMDLGRRRMRRRAHEGGRADA